MLIDMHAHTGEISTCCKVGAKEIIDSLSDAEIDGIILTNHYIKSYIKDGTPKDFAERYVTEYRRAREIGASRGKRVFFGIEASMSLYRDAHILVYGVTEQFILDNPEIYNLTQEELYKRVKAVGGYLVHAHPLRVSRGVENYLFDFTLLDGIELNSHIKFNGPLCDKIFDLARRHGLFVTSGGDYHADTARTRCGAFLPDCVQDSGEAVKHLIEASSARYLVEEPDGRIYETVFKRDY